MEPTNNPTPTPNPAPNPAPVPPVPPVNPAAQAAPVVTPTAPAPAAPAGAPVTPAAPAGAPAAPTAPVIPTPVNPVFQPTGGGMVGATTPITMPERPAEPDPIEEELKAPFKAAAPVPGSIGSAVSVPREGAGGPVGGNAQPQNTPNVAFNDPATAQAPMGAVDAKPAKKKLDKKSLIMLCVIAGVVVIALAVVLIMMMNG